MSPPNGAPHPLDVPKALARIFHPRPDPAGTPGRPVSERDAFVETPDGARLHARFWLNGLAAPVIVFFHGNGEIVSDYDEIAPLILDAGLNVVFAEYRGYGLSTGEPGVAALFLDSLALFDAVMQGLRECGASGSVLVMGRSLGSACALELAEKRKEEIDGLVIESGFAFTLPLLERLGLDPDALGLGEADGFGNLEKMAGWEKPLAVIHAEEDEIIPLADARALFKASPSTAKTFLAVPRAGHNDILLYGMDAYLDELGLLAARSKPRP